MHHAVGSYGLVEIGEVDVGQPVEARIAGCVSNHHAERATHVVAAIAVLNAGLLALGMFEDSVSIRHCDHVVEARVGKAV